jgi:glycosyltransferase involved in cell wall biosynthesis
MPAPVARVQASILIPLLRQSDIWLEQAVRSALAQTVPCEVIVVTAPATPSSNLGVLDRLQVQARDRLRIKEAPQGFAVALNQGIANATTSRIGLLLSDDWLEPTAVEACLPLPVDIVSTGKRFYAADGVTEFVQLRKLLTMDRFCQQETLEAKADYLSHFFLLDRRKVLEVGGVDESIGDQPGIDDYDLIWVLLEHGATVGIVERYLYNRRDHDGERLTLRPREESLVTLRKILEKHGLTGAQRDRLLARKARWLGRPLHVVKAELDRSGQ